MKWNKKSSEVYIDYANHFGIIDCLVCNQFVGCISKFNS
jgi:hypothetical protein